MTTAQQVLTGEELIEKLGRRASAQRDLSTQLRRLARFDDEIRDATIRFVQAGGVVDTSALPGGHSDGDQHEEPTSNQA